MIVIIWLIYTYYIKYNNITYYIVIIVISNNGRGPYSIHFMNQASQNFIKGRICPAGWTLCYVEYYLIYYM